MSFVDHQPSLACMTMATNVIDPVTLKKRPTINEDLAQLTRLADQMECVTVNDGPCHPPGGAGSHQ